jgi:PQQ-like domain
MTRKEKKLHRSFNGNSYRYLTLVHTALLSAALSSAAFAAPKSAKLVSVRKSDGKAVAAAWLWHSESSATGGAAIIGDNAVFVEDQQTLKSMDLATGKVRWQAKLEMPITFTPVANETLALVYTGDQIWAYSLDNGTRLWHSDLTQTGNPWSLSDQLRPVPGDDMIFLSSGRQVACLLAHNGAIHWMYASQKIRPGQMPVVEMDRVFIRTTDRGQPWLALNFADGLPAGEGGQSEEGPPPPPAAAAPATPPGSRRKISTDRRTLTVSHGRRSWKYRPGAPFTIAGVIGETDDAICIQIVDRTAAPARQAASPTDKVTGTDK